MKLRLLLMCCLALVFMNGCDVLTPAGLDYGYFRIGTDGAGQGRAIDAALAPLSASGGYKSIAQAVITIVDSRGNLVSDSDVRQLFSLNGTFVSESIKLSVGTYRLTRFMIADSDNGITYATPVQGSSLAGSVSKPLPISFSITSGQVFSLQPEIIEVGSHTAQEFGYSGLTFPLDKVLPYPSLTIVKYYCLGPNGVAFDGDDVFTSYAIQDYTSYYDNKDAKTFNTVNGQMGDGDDTVSGWWMAGPAWNQGSWRQGGPGADNAWFTADDLIEHTESWQEVVGGVDNQPICTSPGPDGVWFTADDVQTAYYLVTNDANGNLIKRAYYVGTGTSGVLTNTWFGAYYINTYSGTNNRYWSWTRQDRYNADGSLKEYVIHEFADPKYPKFFTKELYYNPQGQVTRYATAVNYD